MTNHRKLIRNTVLFLLFLMPTFGWASECIDRPPDPKSGVYFKNCEIRMPLKTWETLRASAIELYSLYNTQPTLKIEPFVIVQDREGRIFSNSVSVPATLTWGTMQAEMRIVAPLTVSRQPEPDHGFRPRLKASLWVEPYEKWPKMFDAGLNFEPYFYQWGNVQAFLGMTSFGAAVGADITKNAGVMVGGISPYRDLKRVSPTAGFYFALW